MLYLNICNINICNILEELQDINTNINIDVYVKTRGKPVLLKNSFTYYYRAYLKIFGLFDKFKFFSYMEEFNIVENNFF